MGFWDQRGRPAIMAALEAACDAVTDDLAAELRERDQTRHAFLAEEVDRLKAIAATTDQLEHENRSLREELEHLRRSQRSAPNVAAEGPSSDIRNALTTTAPEASTPRPPLQALEVISPNQTAGLPGTSPPPREGEDWEPNFRRLAKRFAALQKKFEVKRNAAKTILDQRDAWMRYAESLEAKLKKFEKRHMDGGRLSAARPSSITGNNDEGQQAVITGPASSFVSNPEATTGQGLHEDAIEDARTQSRRAASTPVTAITQDDVQTEGGSVAPSTNRETSDSGGQQDDLPSLPPITTAKQRFVPVKHEPSSDGPVVICERSVRKRKNTDDGRQLLPPSRRIKHEYGNSSDPVVTAELGAFSPHESVDLDAGQGMPTPRKQRPIECRRGLEEEISNETEHQQIRGTTSLNDGGLLDSKKKPKRYGHIRSATDNERLDDGIADVARDDFLSVQAGWPRQTGTGLSRSAPERRALQTLLDYGLPERDPAVLRPTRQARGDAQSDTFEMESRRSLQQHGKRMSTRTTDKDSMESKTGSAPKSRPTRGNKDLPKPRPLRERPLTDLRPEDFKVNPKSNNGYTHAFNDVVRGKTDRAELSGCTDPNCCGKMLRAMAESELKSGGALIPSRVEDIKLLENYLGDEAYRLALMTREEKQATWLEAKIHHLANTHGRHRHKFARRASPPGYWNPEFPTTQEIEAGREEEERANRRVVEERWREATRGGGLWLFRDE
ncbi:DNA repair protein endonuclease SAE2/CtIP C-terminus-domain-containing protein [Podospora appendiculata]|uniref:DNA repair protein endonuclease SAE2/CtIP C-terminus-domain-containing protein n=1 Tax=Podospora appendiculata TaxID=314037 RepID=A0AAE0WZJ8_9PEZI|nr:DNA repair protein endonuclease SAE2/CtIP C-terminus-domain-containing protein [Podospora appendiculata]